MFFTKRCLTFYIQSVKDRSWKLLNMFVGFYPKLNKLSLIIHLMKPLCLALCLDFIAFYLLIHFMKLISFVVLLL